MALVSLEIATKPRQSLMVTLILMLTLLKCGLVTWLPRLACYFTPTLLLSDHFVCSAVNVNRHYT